MFVKMFLFLLGRFPGVLQTLRLGAPPDPRALRAGGPNDEEQQAQQNMFPVFPLWISSFPLRDPL